MREILFKAKRDGSGEWVEGCYAECKGNTFIGIGISIGIDSKQDAMYNRQVRI